MITIEETIEAIHNSHGGLTDEEIQLIVQFAFKTGDVELTLKMIEEFTAGERQQCLDSEMKLLWI